MHEKEKQEARTTTNVERIHELLNRFGRGVCEAILENPITPTDVIDVISKRGYRVGTCFRSIICHKNTSSDILKDIYYNNKEYVVWYEDALVAIANNPKTPLLVLKDMMVYESSPTMQILASRQHISSVAARNLSIRENQEHVEIEESKMRESFKKFMAEEQGKNAGDIDKMFDEWKKGKEKI